MRRALLVVLAALIAAPASASVLAVQCRVTPNESNRQQNFQLQAATVLSILRNRGVTLRLIPETAAVTADVAAARFSGSRGVEQHDGFILLGAATEYSQSTATFDPRTYLRTATWPSKPGLWFIAPLSSNAASNTATDTTGVSDSYASGQALNGSLYTTGHPWAWKNLYASVKPAIATTPRAAGYWRALVSYGDTPANLTAVKDADSLNSRSLNPDSVIVWMRAKSGSAADLARAQIFCRASAGGLQDIAAIKHALAMFDSLSAITTPGGKVFDNRPRTTRKHGLVLTAANRHGSPTAYSGTEGGGIYCPSIVAGDTCDRDNFSAGVDSMISLTDVTGRPIRFTWLVEPESLTTTNGALLMTILKRATNARFGVQAIAGTLFGTATRAGAAGRSIDLMGILRRRSLFPTTASLSPSCATDSGSVQCNVKNAFDLLEAAVPGRVDRVIAGSDWDWSPQEWTAAGAGTAVLSGSDPFKVTTLWGGEDSLRAALYSARVRAILFSPTAANANVGMSFATSGAVSGGSDPAGWSPTQRMLDVRWGGAVVGQIALLGTRWEPTATSWTWQQTTHPGVAQEYLDGAEVGKYYLQDAGVYYHHTFSVGTRVFGTQAGMLGGPRGNPWPQRPGWWQIKWLQHGFNAANAHLPRWADGSVKLLDEFDWVENVRP